MKSFFISSTFRDMQEERDIIHRKVFPSVRKMLKKYGESAEEVDLRWGVDTLNLSEEESGHMVIKVCIDAIDRCAPYFIVLLGERYGWIPEGNLIEKCGDDRVRQFPKEISITEMEIQYGALERQVGLEHCVFCFRDVSLISKIPAHLQKDFVAESEEHKEKLNQLKAKIRGIKGANILEYEAEWDEAEQKVCGLDGFAQRLETMLMNLFFKEGLTEGETVFEAKLTKNAEFTMQQYVNTYVNREKAEEMLPILYASGKSIWFSGEDGVGKTSLLSFAAYQCRQKNMISRIYYGGNKGCQNVDVFLKWLAYELEQICGKKLEMENDARRLTLKKIQDLSKLLSNRVMIFVDAVNQMSEDTLWVLIQLLKTTTKLQFFVTSKDHLWDLKVSEAEDLFVMRKLDALTGTELELIVSKVAGRRGKSLDVKVTKRIRSKENMYLPINLSLLLQRLFMMDGSEFAKAEQMAPGMEGISKYMQALVETSGESSEELVEAVLHKTIEILHAEGGASIIRLLGMIAIAPEGISTHALARLCPEINTLHIQQVLCFLYDMVEETEKGRWTYRHSLYKECIRRLIGEETAVAYEEELYAYYKDSEECNWTEWIALGMALHKEELAQLISEAIAKGDFTEEQFWSLVKSEQKEQNYFITLAGNTDDERYVRSVLHGIDCDRLDWSEEIVAFLKALADDKFTEKETQFYLYGAKAKLYQEFNLMKESRAYTEKQYDIYKNIENISKELLLEMVDICVAGCCSYDLERGKVWWQRLSAVEKQFSANFDDANEYVRLNEVLVWYWQFLQHKEFGKEENLKKLKELLDGAYSVYKVQDNLNLYEQERPGHNEKCMKQLAIFARNFAGIHLEKKAFGTAYPYAKIAYEESKKAFLLNRTYNTAYLYCWNATNIMRCMKKDSDSRIQFYEEAHQALDWMDQQYVFPSTDESRRYLYTLEAEGSKKMEMLKKALEVSRRLYETFPEYNYEEWPLYDCRKYIEALFTKSEHLKFDEILELLSETEERAKTLYNKTNDGYFLDLLHEWALNMTQLYSSLELFEESENYLQQAEEYLKCEYIQKARFRWFREVSTVIKGITLYYKKGDKAKAQQYMQMAEVLFADEKEKNKNTTRRNHAILWSARIMYMRARMLWEETHDNVKTREIVDAYFKVYGGVVDANEQKPMYLLLGELEADRGDDAQAYVEWKKVWFKPAERTLWDRLGVTEYEVWQDVMTAKALLLTYDLADYKNPRYLTDALRTLTDSVQFYTKDANAAYRKTAGNLLAKYFMKYRDINKPIHDKNAANVLLKWMEYIAKEREFTDEECEMIGECLVCGKEFCMTEDVDSKVEEWLTEMQKKYPADLRWKDRFNYILILKALKACVKGTYDEALRICEQASAGACEEWNKKLRMLHTICSVQNDLTINDISILEEYVQHMENTKYKSTEQLWFYLESLIAIGKYDSETEESCYRKAVQMLEEKVLEKKKGIPELWNKDFILRTKCLEYSQKDPEKIYYIEDLKACRMAYVNNCGHDKESTIKLLEWDGRIARAYEGVDEKKEWTYWESLMGILKTYMIKKEMLNVSELEGVVAFYEMLVQKMYQAEKWRYYTISWLIELAYETTTRLYDLTEEPKWLEKMLEATETYRMQIQHPKFDENRQDFRNEKVAESYEYDMEIYHLALERAQDDETIVRMVEAGRTWVACVPEYYKHLVTKAIGVFKEFDELLEGRSLELKALIQTLQMTSEGNSNEIFWFIKDAMGKYGTALDLDQLRELYQKEQEGK